jgi:hypothetical protein
MSIAVSINRYVQVSGSHGIGICRESQPEPVKEEKKKEKEKNK